MLGHPSALGMETIPNFTFCLLSSKMFSGEDTQNGTCPTCASIVGVLSLIPTILQCLERPCETTILLLLLLKKSFPAFPKVHQLFRKIPQGFTPPQSSVVMAGKVGKHRQVPLKVVISNSLGLQPERVQEGGSVMGFEPRELQCQLYPTWLGPSCPCSTSREGNRAALHLQTHKHQTMALGCTGCPGARKDPWKQRLTWERCKRISATL